MRCLFVPALLLAGFMLSAFSPAIAQQTPAGAQAEFTRENVDRLIASYVEQIWKLQNADGHWDSAKRPTGAGHGVENYGGETALMLLALKVAGADEKEERFAKGMDWLGKEKGTGTYMRGLRATLYSLLRDERYIKPCQDDGRLLGNGVIIARGMHTYTPWSPTLPSANAITGDFSNTQYGVLGVWSASDRGLEVPVRYWQAIEKGYLENQCKDGSWPYGAGGGAGSGYGSMTAGGLATMFVILDKLYIANDAKCRRRPNQELLKSIESGLDWMAKNFSAVGNAGRKDLNWNDGYYFYSLERVGVASGLKYFGKHDWYREVTQALLDGRARPYGARQRAWTLMFLCYGRAPVAVNKLQFATGWNERPRDFAGLCRHLAKMYEEHRNWQIMPLSAGQDELHDAPVLAMSGRGSFTLKPDEVAKLRTFLDRGGLLFADAINDSGTFVQAMRALCLQLYPTLEVSRLPQDHPIYTCHSKLPGGQPDLLGLSDGVRTVVVISPTEMGCDWQQGRETTARIKFQFGNNLVYYASDRGQLWSKEESYWPVDRGAKPARTVTVGRLVYGDAAAEHNWNPTNNAGWQRQDILSRNRGGPGIATRPVDLAEQLDPTQVPILHLTGIGQVVLNEQAGKNLKQYVEAGGLLLIDSAGGRQAFTNGVQKFAEDLFGARLVQPPPAALPLLATIGENGSVWYRHRHGLPRSLRPMELLAIPAERDGKQQWNVIFLPYDLTYAMTGAPAWDPVGLTPGSADEFVKAIIDWRGGR